MTVSRKQLDEKIQTGGGATGVAHTADPVDKKATLPASHLGNGEGMQSVAKITPGQSEQDTDSENNVKTTMDSSASNKASVGMKGSAATPGQTYGFTPNAVREDVEAMFNGTELSEEFKEKATVIFEAAVTARVSSIVEDLEAQYNQSLEEEINEFRTNMTEKIDEYMNYVVEQWMKDNEVAIEQSLRTEITEGFITGLRSLFEEHNMDIPEEQINVVEELQGEMGELQQRLDAVIEENIALKTEVNEAIRLSILAQMTEGLAATQAEKFTSLAEGVEFDSSDNYRKKLEIVKENYFPAEKTSGSRVQNLLEEIQEDQTQPAVPSNSTVARYASAISRTVKK